MKAIFSPRKTLDKYEIAHQIGDYNDVFDVNPTLQAIFDIEEKGQSFISGGLGTYTRATIADFINFRGLSESAAINQLRFHHNSSQKLLGALIEGVGINLYTKSDQFDHADWIKNSDGSGINPIVTANAGTAPDGSLTADRIQFDVNGGVSGGDRSRVYQPLTLTNGLNYAHSIWIKSNTGADQVLNFRTNNGKGDFITATTEWQKVEEIVEASGTHNFGLQLDGTEADTADVLVWRANIVQSKFVTSSIETDASSATRQPDDLIVSGANFSGIFNPNEGLFLIDVFVHKLMDDATNRVLVEFGLDANNYLGVHLEDDAIKVVVNDAGVQNQIGADLTSTASADGKIRLVVSYSGTEIKYSIIGNTVVTEADTIPSGFTQVGIGRSNHSAINQPNSTIARFVYWPKSSSLDNVIQTLARL